MLRHKHKPAASIGNTEGLLFFIYLFLRREQWSGGGVLLVYDALLLVELRVKPMGVLLSVKK